MLCNRLCLLPQGARAVAGEPSCPLKAAKSLSSWYLLLIFMASQKNESESNRSLTKPGGHPKPRPLLGFHSFICSKILHGLSSRLLPILA